MSQPINGIAVICAWEPCSKSFLAFPSAVKRHPKLYCSRPCATLGNAHTRMTRVTLICAFEPCSKPFEVSAYKIKEGNDHRCCSNTCKTSLIMWRKYPGTFEQKFWAQVLQGGPDDCWPWQGRLSRDDGYGRIYVPETQTDTGAHVVAWYFAHGRWPLPGMHICHSCDFKRCTNDRHLMEATPAFNVQDATAKGLMPRGERHGMSKITDAQWQEILVLLADSTLPRRAIAAQYGIGYHALVSREKGHNNAPLEKRRKTIKQRLPRPSRP
jgi:HNH endonuclease